MLNLNEHNITDEFLRRIKEAPNPRIREIVASLARHLHDFARDVKLTEAEWLEGSVPDPHRTDVERHKAGNDPAVRYLWSVSACCRAEP
jgi:Catechol dioxygenase N terminus